MSTHEYINLLKKIIDRQSNEIIELMVQRGEANE